MFMQVRGLKRSVRTLLFLFIAGGVLFFLAQAQALSPLQGMMIMVNACPPSPPPVPTYNVGTPTVDGPGSVTKSPATSWIPEQADITLTATPSASSDPDIESEFVQWENLNIYAVGANQISTSPSITYKNGGNHVPKAKFRWIYKTRYSVPTGHGSISITGYQQYIETEGLFYARIPYNNTFTVTAVPDYGYEFDYWRIMWSIGYGGTTTSSINPLTLLLNIKVLRIDAYFALPLRVNFSDTVNYIQENTGIVHIPVTLTRSSIEAVTIHYLVSGTAIDGVDFNNGTEGVPFGNEKSLTFEPGETSKTIDIPIVDDYVSEPEKTIILTITSISKGAIGNHNPCLITILDDEPLMSFERGVSSVAENAGSASIVATLSEASTQTVTASYAVTGGTATNGGADYTLTDGTLTFALGETSKTITIPVVDDAVYEADETVILSLFNPQNAGVGTTATHTLTITNDDARPAISFATAAVDCNENAGSLSLNVLLSNPSSETVTVAYAATGGTALGNCLDYLLLPGTLTFAPGETSKTIPVTLINDNVLDPNETIEVSLSNPQNATLGTISTEIITIADTDKVLTVTTTGEGTVSPNGGTYDTGSSVSVQATPATGYQFDHWEGAATGNVNPILITMNEDQTLTAVFVPLVNLAITIQGQGSVTPNPTGGVYAANTNVTLSAAAASGWAFSHWTGDVTGTQNPCTVTMNTAKAVTAVFLSNYTLTTAVREDETAQEMGGTITVSPPGTQQIPGTQVTVTAVPETGYFFLGWEGDLSSAQNPATITMDGNKSITAVFSAGYSLSITTKGQGTVTPASQILLADSQVEVTATPATDWAFKCWEGDVSSTESTLDMAMDSEKRLTAVFVYRPGSSALNLESDLGSLLTAIASAEDILAYDTGEIASVTDSSGITTKSPAPNDIPDVAELRLLQQVLQHASYDESVGDGFSNARAWKAWQANLQKAQADLPTTLPEYLARLTAAYMTLGTEGHCMTMIKLLSEHFNITLSATGYDTDCSRYFSKQGDVDNDGEWNREEWEKAVAADSGVVSTSTVNDYVEMAMDASLPETPVNDGPYVYHGPDIYDENGELIAQQNDVIQNGSAIHAAIVAEATGANIDYLPKCSLSIPSNGKLPVEVNVIEPSGFENVPLPSGQTLSCAKGRLLRVSLKGSEREKKWFKYWNLYNTLSNYDSAKSVIFRLTNDEQGIGYFIRRFNYFFTDGVKWSASGYLPEEVYEDRHFGDGAKIIYVPEDTYVTLSFDPASKPSGTNETCKKRGWYCNFDTLYMTGSITVSRFVGRVYPSWACCATELPNPYTSEEFVDYKSCWDEYKTNYPSPWFHTFEGDSGCSVSAFNPVSCQGGALGPNLSNYPGSTYSITYEYWIKPGYQLKSVESSAENFFGLIIVSSTTGPIHMSVSTEEKMTLDADVEVDGGQVPPSSAGCISSNSGSRYYTRISERYHYTELIKLEAEAFPGFRLKRWTGNCPIFDEDGVLRTDVALDAGDDEPARWVTDETIYVKCANLQDVNGVSNLVAASPKIRAVLEYSPCDVQLSFTGTNVVPLNWSCTSEVNSDAAFDYDWSNDTFNENGGPITTTDYPQHWKKINNVGKSKPVAFVRNSCPGLNLAFTGQFPNTATVGKLKAVLKVGNKSLHYEKDNVASGTTVTMNSASDETLPDMVTKTGATVTITIQPKLANGSYGTEIPIGACQFKDVFLLYGNTSADGVETFSEAGLDYPISLIKTVRRMDFLTNGINSVIRKDIAKKLLDKIDKNEYLFHSNVGVSLWLVLDGSSSMDCRGGRTLVAAGLYMIGIPRNMLKTKSVSEGCCAFPSTDEIYIPGIPPGICPDAYSDCTSQEGPHICNSAGDSYSVAPWGSFHPEHGLIIVYYEGVPYTVSDCGGWRIIFAGDSEVENFFKIMGDDNKWYYYTVVPAKGPYLGSDTRGSVEDKLACYNIMLDNDTEYIWGFIYTSFDSLTQTVISEKDYSWRVWCAPRKLYHVL